MLVNTGVVYLVNSAVVSLVKHIMCCHTNTNTNTHTHTLTHSPTLLFVTSLRVFTSSHRTRSLPQRLIVERVLTANTSRMMRATNTRKPRTIAIACSQKTQHKLLEVTSTNMDSTWQCKSESAANTRLKLNTKSQDSSISSTQDYVKAFKFKKWNKKCKWIAFGWRTSSQFCKPVI